VDRDDSKNPLRFYLFLKLTVQGSCSGRETGRLEVLSWQHVIRWRPMRCVRANESEARVTAIVRYVPWTWRKDRIIVSRLSTTLFASRKFDCHGWLKGSKVSIRSDLLLEVLNELISPSTCQENWQTDGWHWERSQLNSVSNLCK
jgi:hypothetical protein